jgi:hypothetical protein
MLIAYQLQNKSGTAHPVQVQEHLMIRWAHAGICSELQAQLVQLQAPLPAPPEAETTQTQRSDNPDGIRYNKGHNHNMSRCQQDIAHILFDF